MGCLFGTFSDVGRLVMGHFESGTFWAVGRFESGTFSDGMFWEWDVSRDVMDVHHMEVNLDVCKVDKEQKCILIL